MSTYINKANVCDRLIEKAIQIFSIKGYDATKLTDITNSLGISRGPVYYHFNDKYGLYEAAYDRFEVGLRNIHNSIFAQNKPIMDLMEEMLYEFVKHISVFGMNFFFMVDSIEELSDISKRYHSMNYELYLDKIEFIKAAQKKGELKSDIEAKMIVDYIYLVYFGILDGTNYQILSDYSDSQIKDMVNLLLQGIRNMCCE